MSRQKFIAFWVLLLAFPVAPLSVNHTIDDQAGDGTTSLLPLYYPDDTWAQGSDCWGCGVNPGLVDTRRAFGGTWHDATYHPGDLERTITTSFVGHAVYVYHILASVPGITTLTNLSFHLDDEYVGQFLCYPDDTTYVLYDVPVYVNTTMANASHNLTITATGLNASLVLFDYILYTAEEPDMSASFDPLYSSSTASHARSYPMGSLGPNSPTQSSFPSSPTTISPSTTSPTASPHPVTPIVIVGGLTTGIVALSFVSFPLYLKHKRARRMAIRTGEMPGRLEGSPNAREGSRESTTAARTAPLTRRRDDASEALATVYAPSIGSSTDRGPGTLTVPDPARRRESRTIQFGSRRRHLAAIREELVRLREQWQDRVRDPPPYDGDWSRAPPSYTKRGNAP